MIPNRETSTVTKNEHGKFSSQGLPTHKGDISV